MASSTKQARRTAQLQQGHRSVAADAASIATAFGDIGQAAASAAGNRIASASVSGRLSLAQTNHTFAVEKQTHMRKIVAWAVVLAVLFFISLGIMGAQAQYWGFTQPYSIYTPDQVAWALYVRAYNFLGLLTHQWNEYNQSWIVEHVPGYYGIWHKAGVLAMTLVCAVLLSVGGMLYQNAFKNPIAAPSMLGASSGVNLGNMLLVALFSTLAVNATLLRYVLCYGIGLAILAFVIFAGKKLSGKGRPLEIVTMLLMGMILSQLLGTIVNYATLFVMDDSQYDIYYTLSQMLTVDTAWYSWAVLGVVSAASLVPVVLYRFQLNALVFDEDEVRLLGVNMTKMRALALVCGAIMFLAAQVHIGTIALVSLIGPVIARQLFGCEFRVQLAGNVCVSTVLLLVCRDLADLIPFVGDGISVASVVSVVALPVFVVLMARQLRSENSYTKE